MHKFCEYTFFYVAIQGKNYLFIHIKSLYSQPNLLLKSHGKNS